jgi:uncharacterized protein YqgV (UPF0045/DUF77 family)
MTRMSAQVSLYPLGSENLASAIDQVLYIFREHGLEVNPGAMSTHLIGDDESIFTALQSAFLDIAGQGRVVMVVTFSNACPRPKTEPEQQKILVEGKVNWEDK